MLPDTIVKLFSSSFSTLCWKQYLKSFLFLSQMSGIIVVHYISFSINHAYKIIGIYMNGLEEIKPFFLQRA